MHLYDINLVLSRKMNNFPVMVKIFALDADNEEQEVFRCDQRELFRKNNWSAKPRMKEALEKLKK